MEIVSSSALVFCYLPVVARREKIPALGGAPRAPQGGHRGRLSPRPSLDPLRNVPPGSPPAALRFAPLRGCRGPEPSAPAPFPCGRCGGGGRARHGGGGRGPAGLFRGLRQLQLRLGAGGRAAARRAPGGGRRGGGEQPGAAAAAAAARRALPPGVAAARLPLQPAQQTDRLGEPRPAGAGGGAGAAGGAGVGRGGRGGRAGAGRAGVRPRRAAGPGVTGAPLSAAAPQGVQGVEEQRRAAAGDLQPAREEAAAAAPRPGHGHQVVQHLRGQRRRRAAAGGQGAVPAGRGAGAGGVG